MRRSTAGELIAQRRRCGRLMAGDHLATVTAEEEGDPAQVSAQLDHLQTGTEAGEAGGDAVVRV